MQNKSREIINYKESPPPPRRLAAGQNRTGDYFGRLSGGTISDVSAPVVPGRGSRRVPRPGARGAARRRRRGSGGGRGLPPDGGDPRPAGPLRGRFSRGFLLAGRKAGAWGVVCCCFCCVGLLFCALPGDSWREGSRWGLSLLQYVTLYLKKKKKAKIPSRSLVQSSQ